MNFLKKLFGGGQPDSNVLILYVKPHRCQDVVSVRVNLYNDLSQTDDQKGYWTRKLVSSANYKCGQVEMSLYFDNSRRLTESELQGGALVTEADYEAWLASQNAPTTE